jgi:polysaccharide biosynthesis/export protein
MGIRNAWFFLILGSCVAGQMLAQNSATNDATSQPAHLPNQSSNLLFTITNLISPDLNRLIQSTNFVPRDAAASIREMSILDDKQKLGTGDRLSFRVIEDQEDPKQVFVNDVGDIDFPYIGLLRAQGRTCRDVAMDAKTSFEKEYYYQATVILSLDQVNKNRTLGRVYVTGQVRMSGPQDIPGTETYTVSKVILKAGGFTDFADQRKVRLIRKPSADGNDTKTFIINVSEIWKKGKTQNDIEVVPDDLIFVPERAVNF